MIAAPNFTAGWSRTARLPYLYLIALGSNQRHALLGPPQRILSEAIVALEMHDIDVFAQSPVILSDPVGPSTRRYANATAILSTPLKPDALLQRLQEIEAHFGRERRGQRWRARVLDLDIILWSGGIWVSDRPALAIPHARMRDRRFVIGPANTIGRDWRDPVTGLAIRHLAARLIRPKPLDRCDTRH